MRLFAASGRLVAGHIFVALASEATGGWTPPAFKFLRKLAHFAATRLAESAANTLRQLLQRLSVLIVRGTARMVNAAFDHTRHGPAQTEGAKALGLDVAECGVGPPPHSNSITTPSMHLIGD